MTQIGGSRPVPLTAQARRALADKRLRSILRLYDVVNDRTVEQKISDAGPSRQRIDPHILTDVRGQLVRQGDIVELNISGIPWYHLATADPNVVAQRLAVLTPLHAQTNQRVFTNRVGQALEIAVFRALQTQTGYHYLGGFRDLDQHDDSTLYSKAEPLGMLNGRDIGDRNVDFLLAGPAGFAAIEAKNIRQWIYPSRQEVRDLLFKCCTLDVVPILIARRIQYSMFSVFNPCGLILHQTYNQLYPDSDSGLAAQVQQKDLLGYFDVRLGNQPDARLIHFLHDNLPALLADARPKFDRFKDLLCDYATGIVPYRSFAARVKRRARGEPEDGSTAPADQVDEPGDAVSDDLIEDYPDADDDEPLAQNRHQARYMTHRRTLGG